jgi:hypothetical protein
LEIIELRNKWVVKHPGQPSRNFYDLEEAQKYVESFGEKPNSVEDKSVSIEDSTAALAKAMELANVTKIVEEIEEPLVEGEEDE